MTPQQTAIEQFLSKPFPVPTACGCMGPSALPGQPQCNGANWEEIKREPYCPCAMKWVEEVDGDYYQIHEVRVLTGKTYSATLIGPVGGPYLTN
jgi:hypothetical protein